MDAKKLQSFLIGVLLLLASGHSSRAEISAPANYNDRITITAEIWCPYACQPGARQPGILVEIVQEIFEQEGITVDYHLLPWRRALMETESGGSDGILGVVKGNRGTLLLDEHGMGVDETVIVVRKDSNFTYSEPESLDSLRLGVIINYTYDNNGELDSYLVERSRKQDRIVTIYRDEPIKSLIKLLSGNRIDGFLENRQVTNYEGNRLNFKDHIQIISTGLSDTIHVGFTPNNRGRRNLDIYNRGLARMLKSGKVEEIVKKYDLEEVPMKINPRAGNDADN